VHCNCAPDIIAVHRALLAAVLRKIDIGFPSMSQYFATGVSPDKNWLLRLLRGIRSFLPAAKGARCRSTRYPTDARRAFVNLINRDWFPIDERINRGPIARVPPEIEGIEPIAKYLSSAGNAEARSDQADCRIVEAMRKTTRVSRAETLLIYPSKHPECRQLSVFDR